MNTKEIMKTIFLALTLAVFYVSAIFIAPVISYSSTGMSFVYVVFVAVLYGVSSTSRNKKIWLMKWGLSIPFSYFVIQYFWNSHYAIRALNWVFPYYGEASAGGNFANGFLVLLLSISCLISGIAGLSAEIENFAKFEKIQCVVISFFTGLTIAVVLILEQQFPSYEHVMSYLLS